MGQNDPTRVRLTRRHGVEPGYYTLPPLLACEPDRPECDHGRPKQGCPLCVANAEHQVSGKPGQSVPDSGTPGRLRAGVGRWREWVPWLLGGAVVGAFGGLVMVYLRVRP